MTIPTVSTVQMSFPGMRNGTIQIPPPSLATLTVTNGLAAVDPADVRLAIAHFGATVLAGQVWGPDLELVRMMPPINWEVGAPEGGAGPDGSLIVAYGSIAKVRARFVPRMKSLGWSEAWPIVFLSPTVPLTEPQSWPGGNGVFSVDPNETTSPLGALNGATVGLYYLAADGVTWLPVPGCMGLTTGCVVGFNLPPGTIEVQISGGTPSNTWINAICGNFF